ncbi:hypothetical protein AAG906_012949 [Vitis piasezkii]
MGGCFSDVRGGKQAVGVGLTGPSMSPMPTSDATLNDAVDHFFRARRLHQLFTQVEAFNHYSRSSRWCRPYTLLFFPLTKRYFSFSFRF